jgi:hypothetical protein
MTIKLTITCDECGFSVTFHDCLPRAVLYTRARMSEPTSGATVCKDGCESRQTIPCDSEPE